MAEAPPARRRQSSFAGTQLGFKDGREVTADQALKRLGSVSLESKKRASITNDQRPGFDHSPIRYVHKFTDVQEYNALADPLLEKHFMDNAQIQKNLISQALLTPDGFVLHTEKKAHIQRHIGAVRPAATTAMDKLEQQRAKARATQQKTFKELCDAKLNNWRAVQVNESLMVEAIKSKVDANRVSVADAPLTEQGRLYVEEKKAEFEDHADHAELRRFELEAERKVKLAIKDKRLRGEREAKKAALEEAIEVQEAELASVKVNIVATKETQQKTMARIKEDTLKKQQKATNEANEFKRHMTKVFEEREQKQQDDIVTRKERAARENEERIAKRDRELAEKEARRKRQIAIETAAREKKLAEMREEDRLRKIKQMEEKEARKEAKRKFLISSKKRQSRTRFRPRRSGLLPRRQRHGSRRSKTRSASPEGRRTWKKRRSGRKPWPKFKPRRRQQRSLRLKWRERRRLKSWRLLRRNSRWSRNGFGSKLLTKRCSASAPGRLRLRLLKKRRRRQNLKSLAKLRTRKSLRKRRPRKRKQKPQRRRSSCRKQRRR